MVKKEETMKQLSASGSLIIYLLATLGTLNAGNILVKLNKPNDISEVVKISDANRAKSLGGGIYLLELPSNKNITMECKKLSSHPSVVYAHPDRTKTLWKR